MKTLAISLAVGLAFAALGYSGYALRPQEGREAPPSQGGPAPRLPSDRVAALGRLEPEGGVIAVAGPAGGRIASLAVVEGQIVRRGDLLATLEGRAELLAEKDHIQAQIREARARLDAERRYETVLQAEAKLERRQVDELETLEMQAHEAKIGLLRENLKTSTTNYNRLESLRGSAAVSQQAFDQARLLVRRDQEELKAADCLLRKLRKAHELNEQRIDVQAQKVEAGSARLQSAIPLDSLAKGLAVLDAKLEQAAVKAPVDGRVLKILARPGEATGTRPILQLGDTAAMAAVAEVYETDRGRIAEGMRAEVSSPALPAGHPILHGTVTRIGWTIAKNDVLGLDPAADAYARVVEARIRLDPDDARAVAHLTNLQVEVRIDAGARGGGRQ